jgi:hypothetical protein
MACVAPERTTSWGGVVILIAFTGMAMGVKWDS